MESIDKREQFILMRAEGASFNKIAAQLGISKSTCCAWGRELSAQVARLRDARLEEMCSLYRLGRAEYIRKLGGILDRIDKALEAKDLEELPADKLLKLKLDYEDKLQGICAEGHTESSFEDYTAEEVLQEAASIYDRIKAGSLNPAEAKANMAALEAVQRAIRIKETELMCNA